jgi:predicted DNA-binding protein
MNIVEAEANRRSIPILVRLTPPMHAKLMKLVEKAGGGIATTVRSIIEAALDEGVDVVAAPLDDEDKHPIRRRRQPKEAVAN